MSTLIKTMMNTNICTYMFMSPSHVTLVEYILSDPQFYCDVSQFSELVWYVKPGTWFEKIRN